MIPNSPVTTLVHVNSASLYRMILPGVGEQILLPSEVPLHFGMGKYLIVWHSYEGQANILMWEAEKLASCKCMSVPTMQGCEKSPSRNTKGEVSLRIEEATLNSQVLQVHTRSSDPPANAADEVVKPKRVSGRNSLLSQSDDTRPSPGLAKATNPSQEDWVDYPGLTLKSQGSQGLFVVSTELQERSTLQSSTLQRSPGGAMKLQRQVQHLKPST